MVVVKLESSDPQLKVLACITPVSGDIGISKPSGLPVIKKTKQKSISQELETRFSG